MQAPPVRPTSSFAVIGFICTLLWGCGFLSLIGLVFSILGYSETKNGSRSGHGLAVAGIVLGLLGGGWLIAALIAGTFESLFPGIFDSGDT